MLQFYVNALLANSRSFVLDVFLISKRLLFYKCTAFNFSINNKFGFPKSSTLTGL